MKSEITMYRMKNFADDCNQLRLNFPEFAKEIDRMFYDVGVNHLASCGHEKCECQMSFEQFHHQQNAKFDTHKLF